MSIRYPFLKKCIEDIKSELDEHKKEKKKMLQHKKIKPLCYSNGKLLVEIID